MKLLIVKLSALGDIINTLPVAMAIREQQPKILIDWVVEESNANILENHPALNEVLISPWNNSIIDIPKCLFLLMQTFRNRYYDIILDLQGLMKSALHVLMIRGKRKIGFSGGKEPLAACFLTERLPAYNPERLALYRYLDLLKPLGIQRPATFNFGLHFQKNDIIRAKYLVNKLNLSRPLVLLHPVAKWTSKLWPYLYWTNLAQLLLKEGFNLALTGSFLDQQITESMVKIIKSSGKLRTSILNLAGKTNLKTLAALQSLASVVVSVDTGVMHLAAAIGTPVVALFGPTSFQRTGPYGLKHKILSLNLKCRPCFQRHCLTPYCLDNLSPTRVAQAVFKIIKNKC